MFQPRCVGCPNQAQAALPMMWGWGRCTWFGCRQPIGDAGVKAAGYYGWLIFCAYYVAEGGYLLYAGRYIGLLLNRK